MSRKRDLRAEVERHHEIMGAVIASIATVEPKQIGVATSAGFYALRKWVANGLYAAESNFHAATEHDELDAEELHPSAPWNIAGMD